MQKHADLFQIVMTLYAFGFVASIVFYRIEVPTSSPQAAVMAATKSMQKANSTAGKAGFKATSNPGVLTAPTTEHEKTI